MHDLLPYLKDLPIWVGAILGAAKSQDLRRSTKSKLANAAFSTFAGVSVSFYFLDEISLWGAAVLSLISASLAVAVVEAASKLTPQILESLAENWIPTRSRIGNSDKPDFKLPDPDSDDIPEIGDPEDPED